MPLIIEGIDGLRKWAGKEVGTSDWVVIDQQRIDLFADATGDHDWLHCDPDAAKHSPFGATVAHAYLSLSLILAFLHDIVDIRVPMALNYGINKARFPAPVRVGSRLRMRLTLASVTPVGQAVDVVCACLVEIEGEDKPACAADAVIRYYPRAVIE